jgi:GT2 family glycosyltransferase
MDERRVSIVVLTCNRAGEVCRTLGHLTRLPGAPPIVMADNGSSDGTIEVVRRRFPSVEVVACGANLGAAGRNVGVSRVRTPYVAFCDDDTWWAPESLERAANLLAASPRLAAIAALVLVGASQRPDPACIRMAHSPLEDDGLPGRRLAAFMAGAVVMRTEAYREVGGYEARLFLGAEEYLLALDLMTRGWKIAYCPEVVTHHYPSRARNDVRRRRHVLRNRMWIAWMRLPAGDALRETLTLLLEAHGGEVFAGTLREALGGLRWALRHRRVVPPDVHAAWRRVFASHERDDGAATCAASADRHATPGG